MKVHTAEQAGAAGILIYSDPADDGFARGETWPRGYWRAEYLLQRGNGKYSWFWHGDPLTPGVGARSEAALARLDPATAPTLPRIPAVVLSWREARRFFERLDGAAAPAGFQGGLPFTYRIGPGDVRVRLHVQMDDGPRPIRDVVARFPGARPADRGVLLGTHHDAWTFGGVDPGTGHGGAPRSGAGSGRARRERLAAGAHDLARVLGCRGVRPDWIDRVRRAVPAASCARADLLHQHRSVHARPLRRRRHAVAARFARAGDAGTCPTATASVYDAWRADEWPRQPAERRRRGPDGFEVELAALGSGADFVAFQDLPGAADAADGVRLDGGTATARIIRTTTRDSSSSTSPIPGFAAGRSWCRVLGSVALRLGESEVLPFRYSHYAQRLAQFVDGASAWAFDDDGRATVALTRGLSTPGRRVAAAASALERQIDEALASGRLPSPTTRAAERPAGPAGAAAARRKRAAGSTAGIGT